MLKQVNSLQTVLILAVSSFIIYNEIQKRNTNPKVFYRKRLIKNYNGFVLPPFGIFIKASEKNNQALLQHEKVHWQQYQREGLIKFLINYSRHAHTHGYDKNPYEIEARQKSGECEYCQTNYTHCVRTGISKTVYNPDFRK